MSDNPDDDANALVYIDKDGVKRNSNRHDAILDRVSEEAEQRILMLSRQLMLKLLVAVTEDQTLTEARKD